MSTTKERILEYLEFKQIGKREFYRSIGVSNGFLDSGKEIGTDKVEIIMNMYPYLNIIWLLTGKGEMELSERVQNNISKIAPNSAPNSAPKIAPNSEKMAGNMDSTEKFPSDGNPACLNCKKLENDIFFLQDVIKANNLSIARYDRENTELRQENSQLKEVIKKCEEDGCTHQSKAS